MVDNLSPRYGYLLDESYVERKLQKRNIRLNLRSGEFQKRLFFELPLKYNDIDSTVILGSDLKHIDHGFLNIPVPIKKRSL